MPEKHLPFYRLSHLGKEKQPKSPNSPFSTGPNLLFQEQYMPYNAYQLMVVAGLFRKLTYAIMIVFGAMLLINQYFNLKLTSQKIVLNTLADRLMRYDATEKKAQEVDNKIKFYEKTLSERAILGDKVHTIFANLNSDITLNNASIDREKFNLDITVSSPLIFAQLANRYLQDKHISSITLKTANYQSSSHTYLIVLEGTYR